MYIGRTRPPLLVILLSVITCGIYGIFWFYTIMDDLNKARGKEILNPILFLLLGILCFPVLYYVLYMVDRNLVQLSQEEGTNYSKENFVLWLLLALFTGGLGSIVAMWQISSAYNEIWAKRAAN